MAQTQGTESSVVEFFADGHILITGSTGFMGKILVEKLLRVCRGISHLYLLIRVKKGKDPTARLKELFDDPVFGKLKKEYPDFQKKVSVIPGDCSTPGLGLTAEDRQNLSEKLTHVFHGAATVRFDEKLRHAISVNVQGVKEMLKFCHTCTKLKSVLHTSTAYANCPLPTINEQFYTPPIPGEGALKLLECLDDKKLELITPDLIQPWPNTYSFTKAIAEDIIQQDGKGLPIGVFRPSIVIGTASEPVPGWIDNLYGPTGVLVGVGAGLLRVLYADGDIIADLVPVDMAVSALICSARDVAIKYGTDKKTAEKDSKSESWETTDLPIYHYVSSRDNPLYWRDYLEMNYTAGMNIPSIKAVWYYTITLTKYWPLYQVLIIFYHLIPALIMDAGLLISGNKPQMWKAYSKIHKFSTVISFFSTKEWLFGETNLRNLWDSLSPADQQLFPFDMRSLNWKEFFEANVDGIRLYLFQDQPSTLPAARRKMTMFYIAHRSLQLILLSFLVWSLYTIFSPFLMSSEYSTPRWTTRKVIST